MTWNNLLTWLNQIARIEWQRTQLLYSFDDEYHVFFNNIFKRVIYETNHSEWNYNCLRSISTLVVSHYNAELVAQRSKPLNLNILALYKYCIILLQYYIVMFIHFTLILYGTLRGCIVGIIYHYEVRVHIISYWVHVTSRYCPVC